VVRSLEICAGAGGQALGLEQAGFEHVALVDNDPQACETLRANRRGWNVINADLHHFYAGAFNGVDLLAGGVPCPPFSVAGKQLGADDERDLFPAMLRLASECKPRAILIENVSGLLKPRFDAYRVGVLNELSELGYFGEWQLLNASDFGVPQLRPRALLVAMHPEEWNRFKWPAPAVTEPVTVGEALLQEMSRGGWKRAEAWAKKANKIAPTLVGGSKKHGGPDLGPTRARAAWAELGVDGKVLAEEPPGKHHTGMPRLTVRMAAALQGFPPEWNFVGKKTQAYRQVGNAFPPPVALAVGRAIKAALTNKGEEAE
jgi:DNA (cytosine-5)-methyltransferase 1